MNKHDFKIRGYIIEYRWKYKSDKEDYLTDWQIDWNKKLYEKKEIAKEALSYIGKRMGETTEYRIVPLYEITYGENFNKKN